MRMRMNLTSQRQRRWLASLLAVAFVLRALIPAGFMPVGNGSLALQICPEGFPSAPLASVSGAEHAAHHHDASGTLPHVHKAWTAGHCAFGAAAGAPALCHASVVAFVVHTGIIRPQTTTIAVSCDVRFRLAQPRAPPSYLA
jgi:hypothetical protein